MYVQCTKRKAHFGALFSFIYVYNFNNFVKKWHTLLCMSFFFCTFVADFVFNNSLKMHMKRLFMLLFAILMAFAAMAKSKMTFVVGGPEEKYNQIRVVNETSMTNFTCRVVIVEGEDKVGSVYGVYNLSEWKSSDSNTSSIWRGTKMGIQMPKDFEGELDFDIEYLDLPLFDIILIHLHDKKSEFKNEL